MSFSGLEQLANISYLGFSHWSYIFLLLVVALEAVPIIGLLVPGILIVMAAGFMVKLGLFHLFNVVLLVFFGAVLGDLVGFLIGRKYGHSFLGKWGKYFLFHEDLLLKTKILLNAHPGKSLILGRFHSLTRPFVPFVAGSTGVSFRHFIFFSIIGGALWAVTLLFLGYVFGHSYESASEYLGKFVTLGILVIIFMVFGYKFIDKKKHIFSKYYSHVLALNVFAIYVFSRMVDGALSAGFVYKLDIAVNNQMTAWWAPRLSEIMIFVTNAASPVNLTIISVFLGLFLFFKNSWYQLTLLIASMVGGGVLIHSLKLLLLRGRPLDSLVEVSGYSFPSGHAVMSAIFFSFLIVVLKDKISDIGLRTMFILLSASAFVLVGFSRIYLQAHWLSDVMAGFAVGIFWITFLILIFRVVPALGLYKFFKNNFTS